MRHLEFSNEIIAEQGYLYAKCREKEDFKEFFKRELENAFNRGLEIGRMGNSIPDTQQSREKSNSEIMGQV